MNGYTKVNTFFKKLPEGNVDNCNFLYTFFVVTGIVIIGYYVSMLLFYGEQKVLVSKDFLNTKYFDSKCFGPIGPWPISHFILYFVIGLFFPNCDFVVILVSVLWELYEQIMKNYNANKDVGDKGTVYTGSWWQGNLYDIFINLLGFYFGKLAVYTLNLNIKIPYINS